MSNLVEILLTTVKVIVKKTFGLLFVDTLYYCRVGPEVHCILHKWCTMPLAVYQRQLSILLQQLPATKCQNVLTSYNWLLKCKGNNYRGVARGPCTGGFLPGALCSRLLYLYVCLRSDLEGGPTGYSWCTLWRVRWSPSEYSLALFSLLI